MFSFLNRTKNQSYNITGAQTSSINSINSSSNKHLTKTNEVLDESILQRHLNEVRKNLLEAILLRRTDIVVSLINEWFKGNLKNKDLKNPKIPWIILS